jgi:hypothetical protein
VKSGVASLFNLSDPANGVQTVFDVYNKSSVLGGAETVGAYKSDNGSYFAAVRTAPGKGIVYILTADGAAVPVLNVDENSDFSVYFTDDAIFTAPRYGVIKIYNFKGEQIGEIETEGFASNITKISDRYMLEVINKDLSRYAFMLNEDYDTIAKVDNFCGSDGTYVYVANGDNRVLSIPIHTVKSLKETAQIAVSPLTETEKAKFNLAG